MARDLLLYSEGQFSISRGRVICSTLPTGPWRNGGGGGQEVNGSWQAQPCRKLGICAFALAEPGSCCPDCETACSSFQSEGAYDVILPRATANSQVMGSANSTLRAEDMYMVQSHQVATPPKDGKISQVFRNPYVWD